MKKTLLNERFQQLAGIRPLYEIETLNENALEGLLSKVKDMGKDALQTIKNVSKDIVGKTVGDEAEVNAELAKINPQSLEKDTQTLEQLRDELKDFLSMTADAEEPEVKESQIDENKGDLAGKLSKITGLLGALSGGVSAMISKFGLGAPTKIDGVKNWIVNTGVGINNFFGGSAETVSASWKYGSPGAWGTAAVLLLAVAVTLWYIKRKQQQGATTENLSEVINNTLTTI